jgi:ATP adenylyltransferase
LAEYDTPVFQTDNFFAVPSLGGFIEGWLLVVSREHHLNLRQVPSVHRNELAQITNQAAARLRALYGPVTMFEHGPSALEMSAGCGIDHAHLHLVPWAKSLRADVEAETGHRLTLAPVDSLFTGVKTATGDSYIFLEEANGDRYLGFSSQIQSQLVRRVLARSVGRGLLFDWQEDPALESVERTRVAVSAAA